MDWSRPPAVAGMFYSDQAATLRSDLVQYLREAADAAADLQSKMAPERAGRSLFPTPVRPKALIAPHAGYVYSGPVAASGYPESLPFGTPSSAWCSWVPLTVFTSVVWPLSSAAFFETPLGSVPVDREGVQELLAMDQVQCAG